MMRRSITPLSIINLETIKRINQIASETSAYFMTVATIVARWQHFLLISVKSTVEPLLSLLW